MPIFKHIVERRLSLFVAVSAAAGALLFAQGEGYYLARGADKLYHPLHSALKPGGSTGHVLGIVGSTIMLTNFFYYARKRLRFLNRFGPVSFWLDFHVFVGLLGSAIVLFHGAFFFRNLPALVSLGSLGVLVVTGVIGRYIHAQIPLELQAGASTTSAIHELADKLQTLSPTAAAAVEQAAADVRQRFGRVAHLSMPALLVRLPLLVADDIFLRFSRVRKVTEQVPSSHRAETRRHLLRALALERKRVMLGAFQQLMPQWRRLHRLFALLMVTTMIFHVGVALWLGYLA